MNLRRLSSALLLVSALAAGAHAQTSSELASLRAKAEKGNGIAQYNLGLAYTRGDDLPADPIEAFVWLSLAQENGARGRALDGVLASLDAATLQTAQQRLAERRNTLGLTVPATAQNTAPALAPVSTDDASTRLRAERDALSTKLTELAGELSSLRDERERLTKLVASHEKTAQTSAAELVSARNFAQQVETTLNKVNDQKSQLEAALRSAQVAAPVNGGADQSARISRLEEQLVASTQRAETAIQTATGISRQSKEDLNAAQARIVELSTELEKARSTSESGGRARYPDLAGRVRELEAQLAEAKAAQPASAASAAVATTSSAESGETEALKKKLAETEDKLATALRGYAFLQRQTDEKAAAASKSTSAVTNERNDVVIRLAETDSRATAAQAEVNRLKDELASLRRATEKETTDLAATRALLKQVQGAHGMLAKENYELKARLAPAPAGSTVVVTPETSAVSPEPTTPVANAAAPRTHLVIAGDSLSKIAQKYYGDSKRWPEIYQANRAQLATGTSLRVGSELRIP
ncbi:LysM peptidoglycan-binding domain-containing protein [Oleiharenicola lentus]|uniref:LysM peptidoglycan-binding domain-containing protein n=1 Tax=Oleiharenicola lentus TaxID=2508720 RepID=UPI003F66B709